MNAVMPSRLEFPVLHDRRYPVHEVAELLEPFLRVIVNHFHPEKIVLFGSYAYGHPHQDSDFDLLVIRRGFTTEKESNLQIRRAFAVVALPRPGFTIISKTPEQIAERLAKGSPFYQDVMDKGLEVYAA